MKDTAFSKKNTLSIRGNTCDFTRPLVMAILNTTPDSFYDGDPSASIASLVKKGKDMVDEGADIIDVGGLSTRPGATEIAIEEEIERVIPVIKGLIDADPEMFISIDTYRAPVAKAAVDAGASMINDVSGGILDKEMLSFVAECQIPYVLMHMRGTPETMNSENLYENIIRDMCEFFQRQVATLLSLGFKNCLILDPGIGFAKNPEQNFHLISNLSHFKKLNLPILVGLSRKSFIYKTLDIDPQKALAGTIAMNMVALKNGADILRVHDVREAVQVTQLSMKM